MKITESYFRYVEFESSKGKIQGFKILRPEKWKGIVFCFGNPKSCGPTVKGKVPMELDFRILDNPRFVSDNDLQSDEFDELVQGIFNYIVEVCK